MQKQIFTLLLFMTGTFSYAQVLDFTAADPQPDLIEVYSGSSASGDIDGDGDIDLLMVGIDPGRRTALYLNDGTGNFTEMQNTPFPQASSSITHFEDFDGDNDLDLFFSGNGFSIQEFAHIYLNDGNGNFSLLDNPEIPAFLDSGAAMADVDNDEDIDLVIAVKDANDVFMSEVYLNDGNGVFSAMGMNGITPVQFAEIEFIDVENDGDADLIVSGEQENGSTLTSLYLNDGTGNYSPASGVEWVQLFADDIDVADLDNDGDYDVLMSGRTANFEIRTILYLNDGQGQFTELENTNLQNTFAGTNVIEDFDQDGDQDIVIIGSQDGGLPNIYNIVYQNLGNNEFIPVDTIGGEYIAVCNVNDFNGDELPDLVIQGFVDNTNVYWNTSTVLSGVEAQGVATDLHLYPNPSTGSIFLEKENDATDLIVSIYSTTGILIGERQFREGEVRIAWTLDLPSGAYWVIAQAGNRLVSRELLFLK